MSVARASMRQDVMELEPVLLAWGTPTGCVTREHLAASPAVAYRQAARRKMTIKSVGRPETLP